MPFPESPAANSPQPVDPAKALAEELFGRGAAPLEIPHLDLYPPAAHSLGLRAAVRYRQSMKRW